MTSCRIWAGMEVRLPWELSTLLEKSEGKSCSFLRTRSAFLIGSFLSRYKVAIALSVVTK